ncbi:MAG: type II secretion system protein GspD [Deltaproteobacteria bacterium]|nr:MAG: type II secretion system protein GspD [Deltaproteobacteria bacterium]
MKDFLSCRQIFLFYVLFFSILIAGGCAGQKERLKQDVSGVKTSGALQSTDTAAKKAEGKAFRKIPDNKIRSDEHGEYRLIETPFGSVRQRARDNKIDIAAQKSSQKEKKRIDVSPEKPVKNAPVEAAFSVPEKKEISLPLAPADKTKEIKTSSKSGQVVLNFDNADLYEVIRTFAEILKINYLVNPGIRGNVTIQTAGQIEKKDLFNVFMQILDVNGLTAVKEGNLYRIVGVKDAARMPGLLQYKRPGDHSAKGEDFIIQVIPLKFISSQEMAKLLTPFISEKGTIVSHQESNTLVLVDKDINILKALKLVKEFDVNIFENIKYRFYPLKYIDVEETVKIVGNILSSYGYSKNDVNIIGIKRINTLLVIGQKSDVLEKTQIFLKQIDVAGDDIESRIYVYSVKNSKAKELADLLGSVFGRTDDKKKGGISKADSEKDKGPKPLFPPTPFEKKTEASKEPKTAAGGIGTGALGSGTLKDEIRITADEVRNILIIEAIPSDYRIVENILNRIDVLPRQVLIDVTVADITLNAMKELGIEWEYTKGEESLHTSLYNAALGSGGLQYLIGHMIGETYRWKNILSALATENKVNILSSPTVLASDNKEATINVTTEVPVPQTTYRYTDDSNNVIPSTIEYRNTGIILTVTPHINEHGLVSMDVSQEVSEQAENVEVGPEGQSAPSFLNRSVSTSLTLKNGQTFVIGGLIRETRSHGDSGVPFLSKIPLIKYLFGKKTDSLNKTELIILITPHVIVNLNDVDAVTAEFKNKVSNTMRIIKECKSSRQ